MLLAAYRYGGYGFYFDPTYFLVVIGLLLSLWASSVVNSTFNKYSKVRCMSNLSGAEAARKVLELTDRFSEGEDMCTLMITHNMKAALEHGNRTILMMDGKIALDLQGTEREATTVEKLIEKFEINNDRMLL